MRSGGKETERQGGGGERVRERGLGCSPLLVI